MKRKKGLQLYEEEWLSMLVDAWMNFGASEESAIILAQGTMKMWKEVNAHDDSRQVLDKVLYIAQ